MTRSSEYRQKIQQEKIEQLSCEIDYLKEYINELKGYEKRDLKQLKENKRFPGLGKKVKILASKGQLPKYNYFDWQGVIALISGHLGNYSEVTIEREGKEAINYFLNDHEEMENLQETINEYEKKNHYLDEIKRLEKEISIKEHDIKHIEKTGEIPDRRTALQKIYDENRYKEWEIIGYDGWGAPVIDCQAIHYQQTMEMVNPYPKPEYEEIEITPATNPIKPIDSEEKAKEKIRKLNERNK